MPRTGNSALRLGINNQAGTFAGVFQDFAVDPGDILDLSYFAKTGLEPSGFESRIEFLDQNGGQISQFINNFTPVLGPEYTEYSLSDGATAATRTAPGNATTARVVFAVQSFVGPNSQVVFVDDVSLFDVTSVPLPAPLLLLGSVLLGGLGVSRYRRSAAKSN